MRYLILLVCLMAFLIFGLLPAGCVVVFGEGIQDGLAYIVGGLLFLIIFGAFCSGR